MSGRFSPFICSVPLRNKLFYFYSLSAWGGHKWVGKAGSWAVYRPHLGPDPEDCLPKKQIFAKADSAKAGVSTPKLFPVPQGWISASITSVVWRIPLFPHTSWISIPYFTVRVGSRCKMPKPHSAHTIPLHLAATGRLEMQKNTFLFFFMEKEEEFATI